MESTNKKRLFTLKPTLLVVALASLPTYSFALEALNDATLSNVTGADGITIRTTSDKVDINTVNWQDNSVANTKALQLSGIGIRKDSTGALGLDSTMTVNVGADSTGATPTFAPAINIALTSEKSFMTIAKMVVNSVDASGNATTTNDSLGEIAIESPNQSRFQLTTTDGLFNKNGTGQSNIKILLDSMNVYITKKDSSGNYNQIIAADIRANIDATGKIWIDATQGFVFKGNVSLNTTGYATSTNATTGLQFSLMHRGNVGGTDVTSHAYSTTDPATGGIIEMGFGGGWSNAQISVRGTNPSATQANMLGGMVNGTGTTTVAGDRGIALDVKGNATATTNWQIGEAGSNGYGLRFSNYKAFDNTDLARPYGFFDFGNVYINLANTTYLALPDGLGVLNATNKLLTAANTTLATTLVKQTDFVQSSLPAKDALVLMLRNINLQMVPQNTVFIANTGAAPTQNSTTWSLLTLFNNVNGNIVLASDTDPSKLGLSFALSTQGTDNLAAPKSTTAIGLVNTGACDAGTGAAVRTSNCNQFIGLQNISLLAKGQGTIQVTSSTINFNFTNLLVAMDAEVGSGYLPGATMGDGTVRAVTGFNDKSASLMGLRMRLKASDGFVNLTPGYDNGPTAKSRQLTLNGQINLDYSDPTTASMIQIVDSYNGTTIGLEGMSGRLQFKDVSVDIQSNAVEFAGTLLINPNALATGADDFRIHSLTMYPTGDSTKRQDFGELAMSGGQLYARVKLTPR